MGGRAPLESSRQSRRIITRFGPELDQRVGQVAERQGMTRSELLRAAVTDYLTRAEEDGVKAS